MQLTVRYVLQQYKSCQIWHHADNVLVVERLASIFTFTNNDVHTLEPLNRMGHVLLTAGLQSIHASASHPTTTSTSVSCHVVSCRNHDISYSDVNATHADRATCMPLPFDADS